MVGLAYNCNSSTLLTDQNATTCPHQVRLNSTLLNIITGVDAIIEVFLSLLPDALVWNINISASAKARVLLAFMFRLPLVALSAAHLQFLENYPSSREPLFAVTEALLTQQTILVWYFVSATIPNMKGFMRSFTFGGLFQTARFALGPKPREAEIEACPLQSFSNGSATRYDLELEGASEVISLSSTLRPDNVRHAAKVERQERYLIASDIQYNLSLSRSQGLIIKEDLQWSVHHQQAV